MPIVYESGHCIRSYKIERLLNAGALAHSYEAVDIETGEKVFLKCCKSPTRRVSWFDDYVRQQGELRGRIESDVAVRERCYRFIEFFSEGNFFYQVFEFIEGGMSLAECLERRHNFSWAQQVVFAKVMMFGIKGLAKVGIVHTDLKPDNIYLIPDPEISLGYKLRIIDFDWSIFSDKEAPWHGKRGYVSTPGYASPEHIRGGVPLSASDVFTCGIILGELLGGKHPYAHVDDDERAVIEGNFKHIELLKELPGVTDQHFVKTILNACLHTDPKKRPTALQVAAALVGERFDWDGSIVAGAAYQSTASAGRLQISTDNRIAIYLGEEELTVVGIETELGKSHFRHAHEDARFLSDPQFRLFHQDGIWMIEHIPDATNKTLVDDVPLKSPMRVYDEMEVAVGNPKKGIKKVPMKFRIRSD